MSRDASTSSAAINATIQEAAGYALYFNDNTNCPDKANFQLQTPSPDDETIYNRFLFIYLIYLFILSFYFLQELNFQFEPDFFPFFLSFLFFSSLLRLSVGRVYEGSVGGPKDLDIRIGILRTAETSEKPCTAFTVVLFDPNQGFFFLKKGHLKFFLKTKNKKKLKL